MMIDTIIITYDKFPQGDAGSIRTECIAKCLMSNGKHPFVIGMGKTKKQGIYCDIPYISLYDETKRQFNYFNFKKALRNELQKYEIQNIFIIDPPLPTWIYIKKLCKRKRITLIHDSVEWYSKEQFKRGRVSFLYLAKTLVNRVFVKDMKVIAISKYLQNYFDGKGISCIRVPAILDKNEFETVNKQNSKTIFMYAGSPGKKDYLHTMLEAFTLWDVKYLQGIEIHLYGVSLMQAKNLLTEQSFKYLESCIKCFGRVDRSVILERLPLADYTMLYRDSSLRYAQAGFPTKVVESTMCGVPVVANLSSDLGEYLVDEVNSIICKEDTVNSFSDALFRAYQINKTEEYKNIAKNARNLAEEKFDYRIYQKEILDFMKESN